MKIRELKEYLEGYPDDGEVWVETGFGLSSPVERIELLNFRGPKEHDLLIGPREGHEWANGHADSHIWATCKDNPQLVAVARDTNDLRVSGGRKQPFLRPGETARTMHDSRGRFRATGTNIVDGILSTTWKYEVAP